MSVDLLAPPEIVYPESDGQPMGENTVQVRWINFLLNGFEALYRDSADVFVAADLFWYPIEGDPRTVTAPDLMIAFGRPKGERRSYRQWEEDGVAPQVVWEILSPSNTYGEMRKKFQFFDDFGVEEYYVYDPDRYKLEVALREQAVLRFTPVKDGYVSPRMGVRFQTRGSDLIGLYHPDGEPFLTYLETIRLAEANEIVARAERQRADAERDMAEAQTRRAEVENLRAEAEKRRAEVAKQQAEVEKLRADKYAAKMRKLGIDPDQE